MAQVQGTSGPAGPACTATGDRRAAAGDESGPGAGVRPTAPAAGTWPTLGRWVGPVTLGAVVGVFLLVTPMRTGFEGWWGDVLTAGALPAWAGVLWLARVGVVAGVVLSRSRPVLATALVAWPFALVPVLGFFEWGWWLGVLAVAAVLAHDRSPSAPVPMLLVLGIAAVYCFTNVPAILPIGPVHATSPFSPAGDAWITFAVYAVASTAVVAVAGAIGAVRHSRRQNARAAEESRRALETESVAAERARVARDLHDVVAHHVSLVAVRAESAPYVHPDLDPTARTVLADIATDARGALDELRQVLVVLQRTDGSAERAPQPGANDIAALVDQARSAGQDVRFTWTGPGDVPPAPGYVLYRAAQEALTNARRHAPGAVVGLEVTVADGAARLRAANPSPATTVVPGRGLLGMRERTEALGGTLEVHADGELLTVDVRVPRTGGAA